ncbi:MULTISPECIES: macrolide 2'-phosphotransferase [Paenibacillus]|jgi:macrolide phosphotransferase|uniref:Macrolide 2'-phosphotransferase n=1 Tax=Paenibacillus residui TaxID=629724 RepID=A0ABW3DEZ3_9BACL|nr:macrolide 2'-phosphotransferase [Paenibacillus sp. 32O-W]
MTRQQPNDGRDLRHELLTIAKQNGLQLNADYFEINESGMDFLVAFAKDEHGQEWVLRKPRRKDVWERAGNEQKVLKVVGKHLPVDVPNWRIFTPGLIAYPLLSGHPIATVDPAGGGYVWKFPQDSLSDVFFNSLANTLAALHNIDHSEATRAGVRYKTPTETREAFAANIEEVRQSFNIPAKLYDRWKAWLSTDTYWPEYTVLHHGDLHPPHIIVDDNQQVTGLIDWTEAEIADPGKDFVILYALFGHEGLRDLLRRYEKAGGNTWPRMSEHVAEQWAAYPALVAKFALTTGKEADMEMARGMIANWNVD